MSFKNSDVDENGVILSGPYKGKHTKPGSVRGMSEREMVWHRPVPPTVLEAGVHDDTREEHPAWGLVSASRVSATPGAVLFDSDIRHSSFMRITLKRCERARGLQRDWIHDKGPVLIEVDMSEAQWGAFVSSTNTSGVPCTIRATEKDPNVDGLHYEPRLQVSMAEVAAQAEKIQERLEAAVAAVEEKPTKANIRALRIAQEHVKSNMMFAAKSLSEHAENVVQKARHDIESMVTQKAVQLGLNPQALAFTLEGESPVQMIEAPDVEVEGEDGQTYTFPAE